MVDASNTSPRLLHSRDVFKIRRQSLPNKWSGESFPVREDLSVVDSAFRSRAMMMRRIKSSLQSSRPGTLGICREGYPEKIHLTQGEVGGWFVTQNMRASFSAVSKPILTTNSSYVQNFSRATHALPYRAKKKCMHFLNVWWRAPHLGRLE